jgi:hypothetical protein
MFDLLLSVLCALALSVPATVLMGVAYYFVMVSLMLLVRRVFGEEHRGYYLLNIAVLATFLTFFMIFGYFVRG